MLVLCKIVYLALAVFFNHQCHCQNLVVKSKILPVESGILLSTDQPSVQRSSTSFVTIKESGSPDAALLKHQGSKSATSYTYQSASSGVNPVQSSGSSRATSGQSSGSYHYGSKSTYTSSSQSGGGTQHGQQTRDSGSRQRYPSTGIHRSSTSFVQVKEGGTDDSALVPQKASQSVTSYQYTSQSRGGSQQSRVQPAQTQQGSQSASSYQHTSQLQGGSQQSGLQPSLNQQGGQSSSSYQYAKQSQGGSQQSAYNNRNPSTVQRSSQSFVAVKEGGLPDTAYVGHTVSKSVTSYQYTRQSGSDQTSNSTEDKYDNPVQKETSNTKYSQSMGDRGQYSHQMARRQRGKQTVFAEIEYVDSDSENTDAQTRTDQSMQAQRVHEESRRQQQLQDRERERQEREREREQKLHEREREKLLRERQEREREQVRGREETSERERQEIERQNQAEQRRLEIERRNLEAERHTTPSSGSRCMPCIVNGTSYKGHSRFVYTSGCYKKRCICNCDGSYSCSPQHSINICTQEKQNQERIQQGGTKGCSPCLVNGTSYKGHSRFEYTSGCYKKRCICHCDGSHTCPSHHTINICTNQRGQSQRNQQRQPQRGGATCSTCSAKGKIVNGNSYFDLKDGCIQYKSCICRCNGSWSCPPERAENVCVSSNDNSPNEPSCRECEVYGSFYPGNSRFTYEEGCYEYNCVCKCDGTWSCPPNRTKDICHIGCGECEIQGEFFEGNAYFKQERGCIEYTCFCNCNGSWNCPSDQARNICISEDHTTCSKCQVSAYESYPGNSTFDLRKGCTHYQCTCNCDGSWDCPGQLARNVCKGELPGKCRNCQVADNEFYPGDSDFEMRKDCIHYQCRCNCDGSWNCPGEKARDVCKGEVPGGCRSCRLSETEFYRGDTDFEMRKGCIHYQCHCNCNGSWTCPGDQARNVCQGEVPGGCRVCKVNNSTIYPGNSRFQLTRDCHRFDCVCKCNGSWSCPGSTAVYVCDAKQDRDIKTEYTCTDCALEGKSYKGGKRFDLIRGCYSYPCKCSCDGKWTCDTNNAKNTCATPTNTPGQCSKCVVNGKEYPGGSEFRIRRGCISYQCKCDCDGRWECPSDRASNFCPGSREPTESCKPCIVDETNYKAGEHFDIKRGCVRYRCRCRCDGSYGCHVTEDTACGAGELPAKCGNCVIDGYVYPGNMGFLTRNGCIQKACQCNCDGTYDCPRSAIQNICTGDASVNSHGSQILGTEGAQSQSQAWTTGTDQYNSQTVVTSKRGGQFVPGAAVPAYTNTGTLSAHAGRKVVSQDQYISPIGPDGTQRIIANAGGEYFAPYQVPVRRGPATRIGDKQYYYQGGRQFVPRGGREFYSRRITDSRTVPAQSVSRTVHTQTVHTQTSSVYNRRPFPPLPGVSRTNVRSKEYSVSQGCKNCTIEGNSYLGNSEFQITQKCIQYDCRCDCSGSWTCSGEFSWSCTPKDGPLSGDCRSCVVKDVEYPPNHKFTLQQGCSEYECQCNCDGRWFCPTQTPKDICGPDAPQNEQPSQCHTCVVRDTEYPADSEFFLNEDCKQYTCTCQCDGSWICPDSKTVNICNNERESISDFKTASLKDSKPISDDSSCIHCQVNGKSYLATKDFQFREGCSKYKCHCFCNGTWECPANETVNMCRSPDYRIDGCKSCNVNNETYPGGTAFRYREGCWEFNCFCGCNGVWECPPERSIDLCKNTGGVSSRCKPCIINGKFIKSKSVFNMRHGCHEFLCDCKCDGSHECPPERSLNICEEGRLPVDPGLTADFKGCEIGNRKFFTRLFVYTEDCIQYMCICYENGAWKCPPQKSRRVC